MTDDSAQVERLKKHIADSAANIAALADQAAEVARIAAVIVAALKAGGKVLTAGNGGSAAEALHMAEEFVGRFRSNRLSLPAVSLVADATALTCIINDFGYEAMFSRQVQGLGRAGDVLVAFSTSGNSTNLMKAVEVARAARITTVCLLGRNGGAMAGKGDHQLIVAGNSPERVQEVHQVVMHLILDVIEEAYHP